MRPALNVGISVSRVGGSAQIKAMRRVAGKLKGELAQYRDLEAFSQFGSELDAVTQATLARGERQVQTLNQPAFAPWPVEEQVAIIYSAGQGYLDRVAVEDVIRVNEEIRSALRDEGTILASIRETKELSDDVAAKLDALLTRLLDTIVGPEVAEPEPAAEEAPAEDAEKEGAAA